MYETIEKYGRTSKEVLIASQNLDPYINEYQKKEKYES